MKLQRNNKYSKMIVNNIAAVLLSCSILSGCAEGNAIIGESSVPENISMSDVVTTPVVEIEPQVIEKDENYYMSYSQITDAERERRLSNLDVKYPNAVHNGSFVNTLVIKGNGSYKIIPVITVRDPLNNVVNIYDLFTEEKLFDCDIQSVYNDTVDNYSGEVFGIDFNNISNVAPYFRDKEIFEAGACFYITTFFEKHIDEFRNEDNINYNFDADRVLEYIFELPFVTKYLNFTTAEFADYYVTTVPLEYQVTSKELGLTITSSEDDKYFDFWKISDEELESRLNDFDMIYPDESIPAGAVQTLVFEDSDKNLKIMNVLIHIENGVCEFKDLYTGIKLFDAPMYDELGYAVSNEDETDHFYTGISLDKIFNVIPYFQDKTIIKLDDCTESNYFVGDHIAYFREKDGINYKRPELSYYFCLYPVDGFVTDEFYVTREEYARCYLTSVPVELQVLSKDITLGLDAEKVKVLN